MKTEVPKKLVEKIYKLVEDVRASGKIKKGTNEATKSVERAEARLVIVASDVNPPEIIAHLPMLCEEKKIPYVQVPAKTNLGAAAGLPVGTSAVAIVQPGEAAKKLNMIIKQINALTKKTSKEKPAKEKPVKKEESKKESKEEKKPVKKEVKKEPVPTAAELAEKKKETEEK
ncbi:50S ribosomal protein L7ae, partial [Candidatus Woesearchaeota archaeon]|nr:50S ribosomal protein L7ae [Candidatus Woesearchaeota archaeon]